MLPAGAPFFESTRVDCESHRLIHRLIHSFVALQTRMGWNNRPVEVLLLRASGVERQTKHGTPAASVAGVYSFMGSKNRHPKLVWVHFSTGRYRPSY